MHQNTSADCPPSPPLTVPTCLSRLPCPVLLPRPTHPTALLQATSANYKPYAQRLATWGFATLQYDFMRLSPWIDQLCHSDAAEVSGKEGRVGAVGMLTAQGQHTVTALHDLLTQSVAGWQG